MGENRREGCIPAQPCLRVDDPEWRFWWLHGWWNTFSDWRLFLSFYFSKSPSAFTSDFSPEDRVYGVRVATNLARSSDQMCSELLLCFWLFLKRTKKPDCSVVKRSSRISNSSWPSVPRPWKAFPHIPMGHKNLLGYPDALSIASAQFLVSTNYSYNR